MPCLLRQRAQELLRAVPEDEEARQDAEAPDQPQIKEMETIKISDNDDNAVNDQPRTAGGSERGGTSKASELLENMTDEIGLRRPKIGSTSSGSSSHSPQDNMNGYKDGADTSSRFIWINTNPDILNNVAVPPVAAAEEV